MTIQNQAREGIYVTDATWRAQRPGALVVCCSDGRLQVSVDEFLHNILAIEDYDRLYMPGGAGALSTIGYEYTRANQYRAELQFLLKAHSFGRIVLLFHGAAPDGPEESVCAHYKRLMPTAGYQQRTARHVEDRDDAARYILGISPEMQIDAYRAEVTAEQHVRFVELGPST